MKRVLVLIAVCALLIGCNRKKTIYINTIPDELEQIEQTPKVIKPVTDKVEPKKKEKIETVDVSRTIFFAFDSERLDSESIKSLNRIVMILKNNQDIRLILKGACCPIGEFWYNKGLGYRRGNNVYNYISDQVDNDMVVISLGENDLITNDPDLLHLNRRCEIEARK